MAVEHVLNLPSGGIPHQNGHVMRPRCDSCPIPSDENATDVTQKKCPLHAWFLSASRRPAAVVCESETTRVLSRENNHLCVPALHAISESLVTSQIRTEQSNDADAMCVPSGENVTEFTQCLCPSSTHSVSPEAT